MSSAGNAKRCRAERQHVSPRALTLLTSMQWFYGPTWGSTLKICQPNGPKSCANWDEFHSRTMELTEVLRRNLAHPAVAEVHVLVGEVEPVQDYLVRLPWYQRKSCMLQLVGIHKRPTFSDYMGYVNSALRGRTVVITNQDVFLGQGWWDKLPSSLPPKTAFLLSRYHQKISYDRQHSLAAGLAMGIFNTTWTRPVHASHRQRASSAKPSNMAFSPRHTCDMSAPRMGMWWRSLCTKHNFGSYDAYVLRLDEPLSQAEIQLFDYPQNAWGGENVFQYLLQVGLELKTRNPCLGLQVMHMHCELPTTFSPEKVGDRRLGKYEIAYAAQKKLLAMGKKATLGTNDIGTLKLNVTFD